MSPTSLQSTTDDRVIVAGVDISPDHYIDGKRVAYLRTFDDLSPMDESLLAHVSAGGRQEVGLAVEAAERSFPDWAALVPAARLPYLSRFAGIIEERVEDMAAVEAADNGSLLEASRLRMMRHGAGNIRFFAKMAAGLRGEEWNSDGVNARNRVVYSPAGPTALITPRNAPFMLSTWKVGPALAAGTVWVNCFYVRDLAPPFGGARQSGIGREGGHWSFDFYCDVKTVCHRLGTFRG